jgi:poly [ADP-ribose] polymerase
MNNVKKFLISGLSTTEEYNKASKLLNNEQDTLDTMAGQVNLVQAKETKGSPSVDILKKLGLQIEMANEKEISLVKNMLKSNANRVTNVFKVKNINTENQFKKQISKVKNKKTTLFFHGSRNQNWFNILQTGLLIRPSGAIHTGSMFGDGIYFANKAQKAIGYSSLRGSYWAHGNDNKGYLGVFETHIGNQKHIHRHDSSCYSLSKRKLQKDGFDSVYAHGGADLRNDEFIVYSPEQCTIQFIVEMKN